MRKMVQPLPKGYKPNFYGFNRSLVGNRTKFYTPDPNGELHPIVQAIHMLLDGKVDFFSRKEKDFAVIDKESLPPNRYVNHEIINKIAIFYEVTIVLFYEKAIYGGRKICLEQFFNPQANEKLALLKSSYDAKYYCGILPRKDGTIEFLNDQMYCNSHGDWINHNNDFAEHLENCFKCKCGRQYFRGDEHPNACEKEHYLEGTKRKKRKDAGCIKRYWKSKTETSEIKSYFADFETMVQGNGKYIVYAAAIVDDSTQENNVGIEIGKTAMDDFMGYIIRECNGIIWFFNGSKFDNLFVVPWLLQNKVPIKEGATIIVGNSILSITFTTDKGEVTLKDLCKFLPGTLEANCKAFGLSDEESKGSINHAKMTSWDVVERKREKIHKYISNDVTCLKKIFYLFTSEMYQQYSLHVSDFMTCTQLAYAAFTTTLRGPGSTLYKTPIEDEEMMRSMYKGGRVICGRPIWKSKAWAEVVATMRKGDNVKNPGQVITKELYDTIEDYLVYIDANSLYPAAQVNRAYPTGKYKKMTFVLGSPQEIKVLNQLNSRERNVRGNIFKASFLVDVTCPDDIPIPFLMTKSEKGEVEQNLLPKVAEWFTGPELWEASKYGYKVTRVYELCQWPTAREIFDDFVIRTYQTKCDAPRDTPKYTCAKNMLNGLTGKFGQHVINSVILLYLEGQEISVNVKNITEIFDDNQRVLGWYAVSEKYSDFAPFPIHLSAFILAWARIYMSKMMRRMNIHKCNTYCPVYGDTDSLIIHNNAWMRLDEKWKGSKELGQMKFEVHGKIIRVTVLAPKTYEVTYIDSKTFQIKSLVKSKGIPHPHDECNTFDDFRDTDKELERATKELLFLKKRESSLVFSKTVVVKSKNYVFRDLDNNIVGCYTRIPPCMFEEILHRRVTMECVFGGMVRKFEPGNINGIYVAPDSKMRTFNKTDWWARGMRKLSPADRDFAYPTAYPLGHVKLDGIILRRKKVA